MQILHEFDCITNGIREVEGNLKWSAIQRILDIPTAPPEHSMDRLTVGRSLSQLICLDTSSTNLAVVSKVKNLT